MEKLPILREDFTEFSWTEDGDIATAAEKAAAYTAATTKGPCADFHRTVWNEMVILFAEALQMSGLSWDASFGAVSETTMQAQYSAMTARRFNALRQNMDAVAPTGWKWALVRDLQGYVGRSHFYGVTEKGSAADTLYGWYMTELARKLTLTLQIMKNTADFSEFGAFLQSNTKLLSDAAALPSAPLPAKLPSKSIILGGGVRLPSAPLPAKCSALTQTDAFLYPAKARHLQAETVGVSLSKANAERKNSALISFEENIKSLHSARMKTWLTRKVSAKGESFSLHTVDLDFWSALHLLGFPLSHSVHKARTAAVESMPFAGEGASGSLFTASAVFPPAFVLSSYAETSDSLHTATGVILPPVLASAKEGSLSIYQKPTMEKPKPMHLDAQHLSLTEYFAQVIAPFVFHVGTMEKSFSAYTGEAAALPVFPLHFFTLSASLFSAKAVKIPVLPIIGKDVSMSFADAVMRMAEAFPIGAKGFSLSVFSVDGAKLPTRRISLRANSESAHDAVIDTAWIPPQGLEKGVYYVRQVYDYTFEDGILEVS